LKEKLAGAAMASGPRAIAGSGGRFG
jgi:hypothetical protein